MIVSAECLGLALAVYIALFVHVVVLEYSIVVLHVWGLGCSLHASYLMING
jgi:hypothetical protein